MAQPRRSRRLNPLTSEHGEGEEGPAASLPDVDREHQPALPVDTIAIPAADPRSTTPAVEDVVLPDKGTNRLKMEEWLKQHKELIPKARDVAQGDDVSLNISAAFKNTLSKFPKRRNLQVVATSKSVFRYGAENDDIGGEDLVFLQALGVEPKGTNRPVLVKKGTRGVFRSHELTVPRPTAVEVAKLLQESLERMPLEPNELSLASWQVLLRNALLATPSPNPGALRVTMAHWARIGDVKGEIDMRVLVPRLVTSQSEEAEAPTAITASPSHLSADIHTFGVSLNADDISLTAKIPQPLDVFSFEVPKSAMQTINSTRKKANRQEVSTERWDRCLQVGRWIASELILVQGSMADLSAHATRLKNAIPGVTGRWDRLICKPNMKLGGYSTVRPLKWVKDSCPQLPDIELGKMEIATRTLVWTRICTRIHETYHSTSSATEAWMAGCELADAIIQFGLEEFQSKCMCSAEESATQRHFCDGCWAMFACATLGTPAAGSKLKICVSCREKANEKEGADKIKEKDSSDTSTRRLDTVETESRLLQDDPKSGALEREKFATELRKKFDGAMTDFYLDSELGPSARHESDTGRRNMFAAEVDAVFPACWHEGRIRRHVPSNCEKTAAYVNSMKSTYPPIVLRILYEILVCPQEDTHTRADLLARLDHISIVRLELPLHVKEKLRTKMNRTECAEFLTRCHNGLASEKTAPGPEVIWKYKHASWRHAFSAPSKLPTATPQLDAVVSVLEEIQIQTHRLPVIDGVPYPFSAGPSDPDWSWQQLYYLLSKFLMVIIRHCNNRWKTDLSVPILTIILYWSVLNRHRPEWAELLRLGLSPWVRSVMSMSFGKRNHFRGMTGPLPQGVDTFQSLSDFVWDECNIIAESWTSNQCKNERDDMADEIVNHFKQHFRRFNSKLYPDELPALPDKLPMSTRADLGKSRDLVEAEAQDADANDDDDEIPDVGEDAEILARLASDGTSAGDISGPGNDEDPPPPTLTFEEKRNAWQAPLIAQIQELKHLKNVGNIGNTCYASTAFQIAYNIGVIKDFVSDSNNFIYQPDEHSGRVPQEWLPHKTFPNQFSADDTALAETTQEQLRATKRFIDELRRMFQQLGSSGTSVVSKPKMTILFEALRGFDPGFEYEMHDPAELFLRIMEGLIHASDSSNQRQKGEIDKLDRQHDALIEEGRYLPPLRNDIFDYDAAYTGQGRASRMLGNICIQYAKEWQCEDATCKIVTRRFDHELVFRLSFPETVGGVKLRKDHVFTLEDMLRAWAVEELPENSGLMCPLYEDLHTPRTHRIMRRVTICPPILMISFNRKSHLHINGKVRITYRLNHVDLPEFFSIRSIMHDVRLPSEEVVGRYTTPLDDHVYRLEAVDMFQPAGSHYVACCRTDDGWAAFDDMTWPKAPISKHPQLYIDEGWVPYWGVYYRMKDTPSLPEERFVLKASTVLEGRIVGEDPWRGALSPSRSSPPPGPPHADKFPCTYTDTEGRKCDRTFDTAEAARAHAFSHFERRAVCGKCKRAFSNNSALAAHVCSTEGGGGDQEGSEKRKGDERPTTSDSTQQPPEKTSRSDEVGSKHTRSTLRKRVSGGLHRVASFIGGQGEQNAGTSKRTPHEDSHTTLLTGDEMDGIELSSAGDTTKPSGGPDSTQTPTIPELESLEMLSGKDRAQRRAGNYLQGHSRARSTVDVSQQKPPLDPAKGSGASGDAVTASLGREYHLQQMREAEEAHRRRMEEEEEAHQRRMREADQQHRNIQTAALRLQTRQMSDIQRAHNALVRLQRDIIRDQINGVDAQIGLNQQNIRTLTQQNSDLAERRQTLQDRHAELDIAIEGPPDDDIELESGREDEIAE